MNAITLNDKQYEVRTITNKGFDYLIGSPELHNAIDWSEREEIGLSEETENVDDQILYYADSNEWNMTDKELKAYLKSNGVLE